MQVEALDCPYTASLSQLLQDHVWSFNGPAACLRLAVASVPDSTAALLMFCATA